MIKLYVVNLPQSHDRKEHVKAICAEVGLTPVFIEAVYGKSLPQDFIDQRVIQKYMKEKFGRDLSLGEIGCALSHDKIYEKMIADSEPMALIIEDDVEFTHQLMPFLDHIEKLPSTWELVLLGHYEKCLQNGEVSSKFSYWDSHSVTPDLVLKRLINWGHGTHGYLVSLEGAKKLHQALKKINRPIDYYTADETVVNVYGLDPTVIRVSGKFNSIIDNESQARIENAYDGFIKKVFKRLGIWSFVKTMFFAIKKYVPLKRYTRSNIEESR